VRAPSTRAPFKSKPIAPAASTRHHHRISRPPPIIEHNAGGRPLLIFGPRLTCSSSTRQPRVRGLDSSASPDGSVAPPPHSALNSVVSSPASVHRCPGRHPALHHWCHLHGATSTLIGPCVVHLVGILISPPNRSTIELRERGWQPSPSSSVVPSPCTHT
jgi:hypothetical protein